MTFSSFDTIVLPIPYYNQRPTTSLNGIVIHSLGYSTLRQSLLCLFAGQVSAHFLLSQCSWKQWQEQLKKAFDPHEKRMLNHNPMLDIWWKQSLKDLEKVNISHPDKPFIIQLVHPKDRAWHAGVSAFGCLGSGRSLNERTIGIEIHCPGSAGYEEGIYSQEQKTALLELLQKLTFEWRIPKAHVISHSLCAPTRRTDPGASFPWIELFHQGFGYVATQQNMGFYQERRWSPDQLSRFVHKALKALGLYFHDLGRWSTASQLALNAYRRHHDPKGPMPRAPLYLKEFQKEERRFDGLLSITPHLIATLAFHLKDRNYPVSLRAPGSQASVEPQSLL